MPRTCRQHAGQPGDTVGEDTELLGALSIVYHNGSAGITVVDVATGRFLRVNRRYCDITGRSEAELLTATPVSVVHPEDRDKAGEGWRIALDGGGNWDSEIRYLRPDGATIHARITVAVCARDDSGKPLRAAAIIQDVTQTKRSDLLLRLSLQAGQIGSFHHDYKRNVFEISPELSQMYGLYPDETLADPDGWLRHTPPDDQARLKAALHRAVASRTTEAVNDFCLKRPRDGQRRYFEIRMRYEYDSQGDPSSATGIVIDVTGRVEAQAQIMHLAHHDALTGLPNRTLFRIRLDHALEDAAAGPGFALLCIDLDGFKPVNDRLGHPAGDALLRAVADRLNGMVREEDTLARLGGDEFSIIQRSGHQPQTASGLARRVIAALAAPFDIEGHAVSIGGSIGIARAPADSVDRDHLFKAADTALYRAKKTGRGRHCFFAEREDDAAQPAARAGAARVLPHRDLAML